MKITENLFLRYCCSSLFILLLISLLQTSLAINQTTNPHICGPSSCGRIHNISFPFRLKHDPKKCGNPNYELACENNATFLYLNSQKYKVKAINYHNFTIRLADVSVNNTNTCSFPSHSLSSYNFSQGYPYRTETDRVYLSNITRNFRDIGRPINFMSCPFPLKNSSFLTETDVCANRGHASNSRHTYIKVGHMLASDVRDMCRIDMLALTSWKFQDLKNVSVSEIHDALLYGFEVTWSWDQFSFSYSKVAVARLILTVVLIKDVVLIGVSVPAKIILGAAAFFGFISYGRSKYTGIRNLVGLVFLIVFRFIIVSCLVALLIYKFRRRNLSMFVEIESFLQNDNQLMPIRYTYSDIKKMTKSFREKLGQGGYGTVYKGKLRSGYDVAVKLLGKPGGNGQDFMNEISTIGRIHHVKVVRLVGYCAERSKRALVFDFMPNGSLDKYIYSREKMNYLTWEMKYEIAVGVARGIEYLHKGCDIQTLHFDIKPHNILLNHKFIPKITDFGLAKFYSTEKKTVTLTAVRGTIGYVAPELINRGFGKVSYKADVYSFGMLLIEMVSLKKDLRGNNEKSSQYFPDWIYDCFDQGRDFEIGKSEEENNEDDNDDTRKIAKKMTIVALWCIQMSPDNRPSMNKVLEMLEGEVDHLQIPQRPTQSSQVVLDEDQSLSASSSTESISLLNHDVAPRFEITVQN